MTCLGNHKHAREALLGRKRRADMSTSWLNERCMPFAMTDRAAEYADYSFAGALFVLLQKIIAWTCLFQDMIFHFSFVLLHYCFLHEMHFTSCILTMAFTAPTGVWDEFWTRPSRLWPLRDVDINFFFFFLCLLLTFVSLLDAITILSCLIILLVIIVLLSYFVKHHS